MKNRPSIPKRGKSNPPLKNMVSSDKLEEETKMMEQRLRELKDIMAEEATKREVNGATGNRWKAANPNLPIKNYAKNVLESKPRLPPNVKLNKENFSNTVAIQSTGQPVREKAQFNSTTSGALSTTKGTSTGSLNNTAKKPLPKSSGVVRPPSNQSTQSTQSQQSSAVKMPKPEEKSIGTDTQTTAQKPKPIVNVKQRPKAPPQDDDEDEEYQNKRAEVNLKRALLSQKESNEVDAFLKKNGLSQYSLAFKENGFDDLETVMEIQPKHLLDMKIPSGHQIKLTKLIEKLREGNPQYKKPILPTKVHSIETSTDMEVLQNRLAQATPREVTSVMSSQTIENANLSPNKKGLQANKIPKLKETAIEPTGGDLLKGNYDEEESRAAFLEALNEWRNAKPSTATTENSTAPKIETKKSVKFADSSLQTEEEKAPNNPVVEEEDDEYGYISSKTIKQKSQAPKPKTILKNEPVKEAPKTSFLFGGETTWTLNDYPVNQEAETSTETKEEDKEKVKKLSCWHCYKTVEEEQLTIQCYGKKFCDDDCLKQYKASNKIECTNCYKEIIIDEAITKNKRRFCSEKCSNEATTARNAAPKKPEPETVTKNMDLPLVADNVGWEGPEANNNFMEDLDLTVDIGINQKIISLEELAEKYKNVEN